MVDPAAAKALFEKAASSAKSFETVAFAGCQHELHNEDAGRDFLLVESVDLMFWDAYLKTGARLPCSVSVFGSPARR